jgi:hypothetical protein
MRRWVWVIAAILMLVFVGLLLHGVQVGDAEYVLENAQTICYT